jgi:membrane-bound lytic murein transglycosylase D
MGAGGIANQLKRQKAASYYDLYLNDETSRYVARIVAIKAIMQDPEKYGFYLSPEDMYRPYKTTSFEVKGKIPNLIDYAINNGYNLKILKMYNPWLRGNSLTNKRGKVYTIQFPERPLVQMLGVNK